MFMLLSYGCSQVPSKKEKEEDLVSIDAALNQSQASYLKGCVEAFKTAGQSPSFPICRERAQAHRQEIESILSQDIKTTKPH